MSKKNKRYYGYNKPVPQNILVNEITKTINYDGIKVKEKRYVIVDADTGEVYDDAQGYGYKTRQKAYSAYNYKKRDKATIDAEYDKKEQIEKWCEENRDFVDDVIDTMCDYVMHGEEFTNEMCAQMFKNHGIDIITLEFTIEEFRKWMC